ncbi:hypothetical protein Tco_0917902 [Tanacetum coccineum]
MECLYKEDVDRIFTLDEPFEEMGSEAIEVPILKEEEFAQIVVLGLCVFFCNESNKEAAADYEQEREELRMWLAVVLDEDETVDPDILSIIRADVNTSYHKTFSSMLRKFDRQDLMDLHRLVMKRFEDNPPEGYNFLLIADGWYFDLFNMLVEKRYPLIKEILKKMLNWKLEAEAESTMAFELPSLSSHRRGLLGIMDFYNSVLLIQLDTTGDVPLDLSKDTKPYIKLRSSRSVHWDQQVVSELVVKL